MRKLRLGARRCWSEGTWKTSQEKTEVLRFLDPLLEGWKSSRSGPGSDPCAWLPVPAQPCRMVTQGLALLIGHPSFLLYPKAQGSA